ncbi:MAG: sn-glycerol-3-phosphate ABC transporter ATP-binding protein UgpC [Desulfobacterales bacterium]|nr:MAG: sn-glycerol-3-phosphate ABC transporter ATP-binding protein UgpC [Desulfobacterales bacterium]
MAEIVLKDVTKKFGENAVVDHINLTVGDREFLVLVGPSGCGKTTTLRMIAGLEEVSGGEIYIGKNRVTEVRPRDRDIAMVFQNYALYPHMSVYKNLAFGLKQRKVPKAEIEVRVNEVAVMLGIKDLLGRKPKELSGGQRQRVAMGRAIVRQPRAFLFDEPLSNLDAKLRVQMRAELARLHQRLETTIVYVTHDQIEAMTLADRIVIMNAGVIMQEGSPMEVYADPANLFVAGFIGSPAMNFIKVKLISENGRLKAVAENFALTVPEKLHQRFQHAQGREVIMGIRPEHIYDYAIKGPFPGGERLKALIEVVEPIGSEVVLLAICGASQLTARVDPQTQAKPQMQLELILDMNHMHLFDSETKEAY